MRDLITTGAEAGYFCTSVFLEAPGIALASVVTGAPFITGAPVVAYVF